MRHPPAPIRAPLREAESLSELVAVLEGKDELRKTLNAELWQLVNDMGAYLKSGRHREAHVQLLGFRQRLSRLLWSFGDV